MVIYSYQNQKSYHTKSVAFKKNSKCDSLLLKESERLIRSQRYVREVIITPVAIENSNDSIDVKVRVLDSWTLIPTGSLSSSESSIKLTERNILGFGHLISGNIKIVLKLRKELLMRNTP